MKNCLIKNKTYGSLGLITGLAWAVASPAVMAGQSPVDLASAAGFAILAAAGITSVPTEAIHGNVGLSPAARSNITGLTAGEVNGTIYAADDGGSVAAMLSQAKSDLNSAYINASPPNRPGGIDVSAYGGPAGELGGRTLAPGLYQSAPGAYDITSLDLTLDGNGDTNAVWIFQMATTLTVHSGRQVFLTGGAQARNIFWQVGASATLSTYSVCQGTIMAAQSIAMQTSATLLGRALAENASVTLQANTITDPLFLPSPPSFGQISIATNGFVTVVITNTPGLALTLQTSTNLVTWTNLTILTPSATPDTFIDTEPPAIRRFYRAFYP